MNRRSFLTVLAGIPFVRVGSPDKTQFAEITRGFVESAANDPQQRLGMIDGPPRVKVRVAERVWIGDFLRPQVFEPKFSELYWQRTTMGTAVCVATANAEAGELIDAYAWRDFAEITEER